MTVEQAYLAGVTQGILLVLVLEFVVIPILVRVSARLARRRF